MIALSIIACVVIVVSATAWLVSRVARVDTVQVVIVEGDAIAGMKRDELGVLFNSDARRPQ